MKTRNKNIVTNTGTSKLPLIVSISVIVIMVGSYFLIPGFQSFINEAYEVLTSDDEQRTKEWVSQFGFWGPLVIIVVMILQMFLFVVPNVLLMMIAILSYGPVWGSIIAWVGIFAASTVGYFIGRRLSFVTVSKFVSVSTQDKLASFVKDYGMGAVFIFRLSSFSNDSLSLVAGILKMSYRKFILSSVTGIIPLIVLLAIFGRNGKIENALLIIGGISVICLILYIIIDKRRKRAKSLASGSFAYSSQKKNKNS
ncbi:TVP38/TMEM64 family protein [Chryseosolibacter indicus]|uniref:TVP38/TMEM64 family membrane protein n=1 Tax=Chryseosolibacter indicus TaxID=2782351 RepID=A0ABS5VWU6_9BACT|nr:TVP38/TMEM64 family protein [Chryseosolibacter indicus]MBT1705533.1 TVP38/TMEM64 family protein [Chryseosolibacter indicus]